jgi:hypothetical protein
MAGDVLPLICLAAQVQIAAREVRPIGTTGKSVKPVQPLGAKIFRFTCNPNQIHNSAHLNPPKGRWPRHERAVRCGGREWRSLT